MYWKVPMRSCVCAFSASAMFRTQERAISRSTICKEYGLTEERFARTHPDCVLLHPGPVNRGVELAAELVEDPRSLILEQVKNGLYIRMAVLEWLARVLK